jgi:hypothetical protein
MHVISGLVQRGGLKFEYGTKEGLDISVRGTGHGKPLKPGLLHGTERL